MASSNVDNGTSTLTLDTTGIGEGKHIIKARYTENTYYKSSTYKSTLTLTQNT